MFAFSIAVTQNQRYDLQTWRVMRKVCSPASNTVDVGSHEGEMLDHLLRLAPRGMHFGFEPLPHLYQKLQLKFRNHTNIRLYDCALSDRKADGVPFNYVLSNPAYSGLEKREYDRPVEKDSTIQVRTAKLDELIPETLKIDFIKIDVEGGELNVLKGAQEILRRDHPVIVFEFGLGGSDKYGADPEQLLAFFSALNYQVYLLKDYLEAKPPLTADELHQQFYQRINYYFLAFARS